MKRAAGQFRLLYNRHERTYWQRLVTVKRDRYPSFQLIMPVDFMTTFLPFQDEAMDAQHFLNLLGSQRLHRSQELSD